MSFLSLREHALEILSEVVLSAVVLKQCIVHRVTFDHPPLNIFGPETIPQLTNTNSLVVGFHPTSFSPFKGWLVKVALL